MNIAVIPARGGSQRILRKNVRKFLGVPAITITIKNAIKSGLFEEIYVSTEDEEIAKEARIAGAQVPHMRSTELSDNFTGTVEVIGDFVRRENLEASLVVCIYPVTPLLKFDFIETALELIESTGADYVFPAIELPINQERIFLLDEIGRVDLPKNGVILSRTQDLKTSYYDAGQFYVGRGQTWSKCLPIISPKSVALKLSPYEVVDIDNESDWKFAEELYQLRSKSR